VFSISVYRSAAQRSNPAKEKLPAQTSVRCFPRRGTPALLPSTRSRCRPRLLPHQQKEDDREDEEEPASFRHRLRRRRRLPFPPGRPRTTTTTRTSSRLSTNPDPPSVPSVTSVRRFPPALNSRTRASGVPDRSFAANPIPLRTLRRPPCDAFPAER
jgi:hypothetical protein